MSVTGLPDGVPGGGPMNTGPSLADFMVEKFATAGLLAGFYERDIPSKEGVHIEIAPLDSTIAAQTHYIATYVATQVVPPRRGTEGNCGLPSQAFPSADSIIIVICGSEPQYREFCRLLGQPELGSDVRFGTNSDRLLHRRELAETVGALTLRWKAGELLAALKEAGIPSGSINKYTEVFADPQVQHRQLTLTAEHLQAGPVKLFGSPIRFVGLEDRDPMARPVLGQHTDEVLREVLGLNKAAIADLRIRAVV